MVKTFFAISVLIFSAVGVTAYWWPPILLSLILFIPLFIFGVMDAMQTRHGVRRNFPIIGNLRYFFEMIRPELQQYFVESNHSGRPIPRELRSVVYQRAKLQLQSLPFGTQRDVEQPDHEWVHHSMHPVQVPDENIRILIGEGQCSKPYSASLLNISAMSFGSLSSAAVEAFNIGAAKGHFYHNTGEGGISDYHQRQGDLVWQIGTGYFGCRDAKGHFDEEIFAKKARENQVKMIEVKISQGAKPGKGGLLPGAKVNREIAEARGVPEGQTVVSPSCHSTFDTPIELLHWLKKLRELSGGKPVGIKLCVGKKSEFYSLCKAMHEQQSYPDFITVDGAEGGTGAAPLEFANNVGEPLNDGLAFVDDTLRGYGLRRKITLIASGKLFTAFGMLGKLALGADIINSGRGMMLALGCIQALKCNSNHCPVGVTTNDPKLVRGLHVPSKAERVAHYHNETIHALADILGAMGLDHPSKLSRSDVYRRLTNGQVRNYEELYPSLAEGFLLSETNWRYLPEPLRKAIGLSRPESFSAIA